MKSGMPGNEGNRTSQSGYEASSRSRCEVAEREAAGRPTPAILPRNCTRNDLRRPEIQKFPGCTLVAVPITISLLRA